MRYRVLVSGVYLALMSFWVYFVADRGLSAPESAVALMLIGAQLALGLLIRFWGLLLPPLVVIIAVPAGVSDAYPSAELPIWFGLLFAAGPAGLLIAVGVLAGTVLRSRTERRGV
ncbi:MAG TPA: hypothetical protein VKC65_02810 [Gaiellaceae bacterium]|nr:hypothetical protein [Gaiellaceae bacterium]